VSARIELFRRVAGSFVSEDRANALLDAYRAEVLAEAIEVACARYLSDALPLSDEDNAYNDGIKDALAAINMLTDGGAR
jgi:hypothetical protein